MTDAEKIDNILETRADDSVADLDAVFANVGSFYADDDLDFDDRAVDVALNYSLHLIRFLETEIDGLGRDMELLGYDEDLVDRAKNAAATARVFLRKLRDLKVSGEDGL